MKVRNVTAVTKDRGIITISLDDDTSIKIDCINHKIKSFSGRDVINFPKGIVFHEDMLKYKILATLDELCRSEYTQRICAIIETLWNYLDILEQLPCSDKIPAGYAKYCRDNNLTINPQSYTDFQAFQKVKNVKEQDRELYKNILLKIQDIHYNPTLQELNTFVKIYKSTLKTNNFNATLYIGTDMRTFVDRYYIFLRAHNVDINTVIDTNRDYTTNIELMRTFENQLIEKEIIEQEDKIRDLTKLDLGAYFVIVPETLTDFTKEGQMQNNCVGYFYHESIKAGRNLIYFIRKKSNPDTSYITCRYYKPHNETVEHRVKNNVNYEYDEILRKCDERIRELLSA